MAEDFVVNISGDAADVFRERFGITTTEQANEALANAESLWNSPNNPWRPGARDIFDWAAETTKKRFDSGRYPPKPPEKSDEKGDGKDRSGTSRHVAQQTDWKAVCTAPDYCKVGNSIVGFDSWATLDNKMSASPDVKAQGAGMPVYRVGDLAKGVQADAGSHVVSGTSLGSGHVKILDGQDNVKVNGIPVARHDSRCLINCDAAGAGGAPGRLVTEQKSAKSGPDRPMAERVTDESKRVLEEKWKGFKQSAQTLWEAIPGTSDEATTAAARQRIADGAMGTVQGLGTLMGPPPEMVEQAYISGDPSAIATVEQMQAQQQQAAGAIVEGVKKSWNDAEARSGTAGATSMAATLLAFEIATNKGIGALGGVAARIADIAKLAKSPLEAASLLDKEVTAAKAAGKSIDEVKLLEEARDEKLRQARKEAAKEAKGQGVHVKKRRLAPNATYELNGYKYTTDAEGRIKSVEGNLKLDKAERDKYAQLVAGEGDGRLPGDQGGHLIGAQFGGYKGAENLTPMAEEINKTTGKWGAMEANWANELKAGSSVEVKIEAIYTDSSARASSFKVTETINGLPNVRTIFNPGP
jgi:uncharacterized Zn-binding protein involved in type VI secretion